MKERPRTVGESGYTLKKLFKIAFDGIFSFSFLPLRMITLTGVIGLIFGFSYTLYVLYGLFSKSIPIQGFVSLVILITLFNSLILIALGIVGEYVARIYSEGKNRPDAIMAESC